MTYFHVLPADILDLITDNIIDDDHNLNKLCQFGNPFERKYCLDPNNNYWKQKYRQFIGEGVPMYSYMEDYKFYRSAFNQFVLRGSITIQSASDDKWNKSIMNMIDINIGENLKEEWKLVRKEPLIEYGYNVKCKTPDTEYCKRVSAFMGGDKLYSLSTFCILSLLDNKAYNYIILLISRGLVPRNAIDGIKRKFQEMGRQDLVRRFIFARMGRLV